jgi:hypothetical protein
LTHWVVLGKVCQKRPENSLTVEGIGIISGFFIEFIAVINFWLYSRVANQFGASHICLERTHRYLIAYKIAQQIETDKDKTLRDLVCIMAQAPMITRADVEAIKSRRVILKTAEENQPRPGS